MNTVSLQDLKQLCLDRALQLHANPANCIGGRDITPSLVIKTAKKFEKYLTNTK